MKATFENTVDILVKAYLKGTLMHGSCRACAVGNIISANGYDFNQHDVFSNMDTSWLRKIQVECRFMCPNEKDYYSEKIANDQIQVTGYSLDEINKIELAFESAEYDDDMDKWMWNGLMLVVDALAEIHNIDLKQKDEAKALFVKA